VLLIERTGRRTDDIRAHRGLLISVAWGPHDATGVAVIRPARGGTDEAVSLSRVASIEPDREDEERASMSADSTADVEWPHPWLPALRRAHAMPESEPAPAAGSGFLLVNPPPGLERPPYLPA
jgi:hypothetical protein